MNWDDLRIIAAVRDEGTYAGASARLRIDETTVARRIARLQGSLGVTLFNAVDGLRQPTAQCEAVLAHVHEIARHVVEIGSIRKTTPGATGNLRIASTNSVAEEILAPRAAPFLAANPGLTLQFLTSRENVNFSRWEADLAVRLRKPERGDFTIAKLADFRLFLFEPAATPDAGPVVCCYPDDLDHTPESRYLLAKRLKSQGRCITDNIRILRELITSRVAVGILPEYMCGELLGDRRLRATRRAWPRTLWRAGKRVRPNSIRPRIRS